MAGANMVTQQQDNIENFLDAIEAKQKVLLKDDAIANLTGDLSEILQTQSALAGEDVIEEEYLANTLQEQLEERIAKEDYNILQCYYFSAQLDLKTKSIVRQQMYCAATKEDFFETFDILHSKVLTLYFLLAFSPDNDDAEFAKKEMLCDVLITANRNNCLGPLEQLAKQYHETTLQKVFADVRKQNAKEEKIIKHVHQLSYQTLLSRYKDYYGHMGKVPGLELEFSPRVMDVVKERLLATALCESQIKTIYTIANFYGDTDYVKKIEDVLAKGKKTDYFLPF